MWGRISVGLGHQNQVNNLVLKKELAMSGSENPLGKPEGSVLCSPHLALKVSSQNKRARGQGRGQQDGSRQLETERQA